MRTIKDLIWKLLALLFQGPRSQMKETRKAGLTNPAPTIIANNCTAGVMYHDLDLPFRSPTINLFFSHPDYFEFLAHLEDYINAQPQETHVDGVSYPTGVLKRGEREITVHFMHYGTFEQARAKWMERAKRVDYGNLYVVFEHAVPCTDDDPYLRQFLELPFRHKVMLTDCRKLTSRPGGVVHLPVYETEMVPGKSMHHTSRITLRRYLDDFDYARFLSEP